MMKPHIEASEKFKIMIPKVAHRSLYLILKGEFSKNGNYSEHSYNYELSKYELELNRLTLKYSDEFQQFKTIKEKEERAKLATMELEENVITNKHIMQQYKTLYELGELEYLNEDLFGDMEEYEGEECDCGKCTCDPQY